MGQNQWFFILCDLEIWWMTLKNNDAPLLYYVKHLASFQSHRWIQTGVTVRKHTIRVKICNFLSRVTLKFDRWTLKNNRTPLLCCFKVCASFHSHQWIQTGVTIRKRPIWVKINVFLAMWPWYLKDDLERNSHWSYGPEMVKLGFDLCGLDLWPLSLTACMHHVCHW